MKVLTETTFKLVLDMLVKMIKPHVPTLARGLVRPVMKIALNAANNLGGKHVPDEVDPFINEAIILLNEKQYEQAATAIALAGDTLIDIPNVDDAHERNMFVCLTQGLVNGIHGYIEKKKGA